MIALSMDSRTITITDDKYRVILRIQAIGEYDVRKEYMNRIHQFLQEEPYCGSVNNIIQRKLK